MMIAKLSSMSKSVFTKIILTVTALSFMSLFGVSGYITTANSNKSVIKVDNIEWYLACKKNGQSCVCFWAMN